MPRMTDRSGGRSAAFCHSPRSHDRAVAPAVFVFLLAPSSAALPAPDAPPVNARGQQFPIRRHWRYAVSGQHDIKRRSFARPSAAGCALPKDPMLLRRDAGAKGRSQLVNFAGYERDPAAGQRKAKWCQQGVRLCSGSARACSSWPQW